MPANIGDNIEWMSIHKDAIPSGSDYQSIHNKGKRGIVKTIIWKSIIVGIVIGAVLGIIGSLIILKMNLFKREQIPIAKARVYECFQKIDDPDDTLWVDTFIHESPADDQMLILKRYMVNRKSNKTDILKYYYNKINSSSDFHDVKYYSEYDTVSFKYKNLSTTGSIVFENQDSSEFAITIRDR